METLMLILQYIVAILGFSLIIFFHELGHFVFAKINGIYVSEFFLGFGPKILKFRSKGGTLFGISAIPLGGYCKLIGMYRDEEIPDDIPKDMRNNVYFNKPNYKKFFVIIGGVLMNIVLAVMLIMVFFSMGVYEYSNTIEYIQPDTPAEQSGFQPGDEVIAIDDKEIDSWEDFSSLTKENPDKSVTYTVIRDGKAIDIDTRLSEVEGEGYLGVGPEIVKENLSFTEIVKRTFITTWDIIGTYAKLVGMLVKGDLSFSEARPVSPIGVISIFQQSVSLGFQNFVLFVALVSLILAFGNLIPILPVDGGHIVVLIIESIRRRPVPKRFIEVYTTIGIVLVIGLIVIGFVFDIINPFDLSQMY